MAADIKKRGRPSKAMEEAKALVLRLWVIETGGQYKDYRALYLRLAGASHAFLTLGHEEASAHIAKKADEALGLFQNVKPWSGSC